MLTFRVNLNSTTMFYTVVGAAFLAASMPAPARADDPVTKEIPASKSLPLGAVDGINGKVAGFGGSAGNRSLRGAKGSLSIPLQGQYGVQIDAAFGSLGGYGFENIGGHLFWRDPAQGLFGLYVNHTRLNQFGGAYVNQIAAEGELYRGRWTLQGIAGIEGGNTSSETSTSVVAPGPVPPGILGVSSAFDQGFDIKTRFFDQIDVKYYFTDNWDGYVGHRYLGGKNALALGGEYAFALPGGMAASAFIEGRVGEGEFHGAWGGLKIYFGPHDKPLIARHRQDDPKVWGVDSLFSIINSYVKSGTTSSQFCTPPAILQPGGYC